MTVFFLGNVLITVNFHCDQTMTQYFHGDLLMTVYFYCDETNDSIV